MESVKLVAGSKKDGYFSAPEQDLSFSPHPSCREFGWTSTDEADLLKVSELLTKNELSYESGSCTLQQPAVSQSIDLLACQKNTTVSSVTSQQESTSASVRQDIDQYTRIAGAGPKEEAHFVNNISEDSSTPRRSQSVSREIDNQHITDRRIRRRLQNNESSRRSRQRKRKELEALQQTCVEQQLKIAQLQSLTAHLIKHLQKYEGAYQAAMSSAPLPTTSPENKERPPWFGAAF